jgi:xylulose-5-phosphate/fructose-6-phosphate phosphoketolase
VPPGSEALVTHCNTMLKKHRGYIVEHLEDMPEVRDWRWGEA